MGVHMMLKILAAVLLATVAARHPVWDLPPRELPVGTTYGGDYAWNNEGYEMATEGWSPLALAEEGTIKALNWTYIAMTSDGNFIRPGTANKIFPDAGTTLNWRYNGTDSNGNDKVVIDFCSECPCSLHGRGAGTRAWPTPITLCGPSPATSTPPPSPGLSPRCRERPSPTARTSPSRYSSSAGHSVELPGSR